MLIFSKLSPFALMVAGIGILLSKSPELITMFGNLAETLSGLIEPVMNLINALVPFITDIVLAFLPPIIEIINAILPLLTPITELVVALLPVIKDILDVMIDFIPVTVDMVKFSMPILEIFIKLFTWVAKVVDKLDILKYLFIAMNLPLYVISQHWDKISSAIEKAFGWISKVVDKMKEFLASGSGKVADFFAEFFGGGFGNPVPIPQFATGGFPDSGQIFMARENGINEMVGSFGNRSAVANNDQIVSGIQQGVYNAVMSALQQNSGMFESGGGDVYIDRSKVGRVIAKSVFDEGRRAGYIKV
jgi:phage-related protein